MVFVRTLYVDHLIIWCRVHNQMVGERRILVSKEQFDDIGVDDIINFLKSFLVKVKGNKKS